MTMDAKTSEPLTWRKSACNLCYINCGVELAVAGQGAQARIVKVRGDRDNPRSAGYLCNTAQSIPSYVHHRDRLTSPLRRRACLASLPSPGRDAIAVGAPGAAGRRADEQRRGVIPRLNWRQA